MRVLHIAPTDIGGGADKGSYGLHLGLRARGVDSQMLVMRKYGDDPTVATLYPGHFTFVQGLRSVLDRVPLHFYDWSRENWWTTGWLPFDISPAIRRFEPDVINFHWAGRGLAPISLLSRLADYNIVWTLRDMWALTGGCHYSHGCEGYMSGCGRCPQLGSRTSSDLSSWQWRRKQRAWKDIAITYVAMSNWMAEMARRAPLAFANEVKVIPNGIDTKRFRPADKAACRRLWDLPQDRQVILFGALNAHRDRRKGLHHLARALGIMAAQGWGERASVVIYGADHLDLGVRMPVRFVGSIHDQFSLATLYSTADVMVVPSEEENMGKTALEAMASAVPVVAFANTGQFDVVDHKVNGYLAQNLSVEDLAAGIVWCLDQARESDALGAAARRKAEDRFDIGTIADTYAELYHSLASSKRTAGKTVPSPSASEMVSLVSPRTSPALGAGLIATSPQEPE